MVGRVERYRSALPPPGRPTISPLNLKVRKHKIANSKFREGLLILNTPAIIHSWRFISPSPCTWPGTRANIRCGFLEVDSPLSGGFACFSGIFVRSTIPFSLLADEFARGPRMAGRKRTPAQRFAPVKSTTKAVPPSDGAPLRYPFPKIVFARADFRTRRGEDPFAKVRFRPHIEISSPATTVVGTQYSDNEISESNRRVSG